MITWVLCPAFSLKNALKIFRAAALLSVSNENKGDVTGCRATESKDRHCAGKKFFMIFSCPRYNFSSLFFLGRSSDRSASLVGAMQDLDNAVCHLSWSDTVSSLHSPKGWLSSGLSPMWTWLARLLAGLCSYQHAFKNGSDVIGFLPASQAAVSMQAQKPIRVHRGAAAFCTSPVAGV